MVISESVKLEAEKAIEQLRFVDRSYNLGIWPDCQAKGTWVNDIALMREFDDLTSIRLELLGSDQMVLFEFKIDFNGPGNAGRLFDPGRGVELPLVDRGQVAGHRVVVERRGRDAAYRSFLRMRWAGAEQLRKRAGSSFGSEHTRKITGGRQQGSFHVGDEARHRLVVTQTGSRGFAFARDLDTGQEGIFLHSANARPGLTFQVGQNLSAILVTVPSGIQGRSIVVA